jgi:hypothetical protein
MRVEDLSSDVDNAKSWHFYKQVESNDRASSSDRISNLPIEHQGPAWHAEQHRLKGEYDEGYN